MSDKKKYDDIFVIEKIYPQPSKIFSNLLKSVNSIKNDCLFVLDTNALAVPYSISNKSLPDIEKLFKSLIDQQRFFIPEQVVREFANTRTKKLVELYSQLSRKRDSTPLLKSNKYPLLESHSSYKESLEIEDAINDQIKNYKEKIDDLIAEVAGWHWNDPVSLLYENLFSEKILISPNIDTNEISEKFDYRIRHQIPPGYKDAAKEDNGIGDYLIWLSILNLGKRLEKDVIFVSGEEKSDWFHKAEKQALYPRFELVEEFGRESNGNSFQIVSFSDFLTLFDATDEIVKEARKEESVKNTLSASSALEIPLFVVQDYHEERKNFQIYRENVEKSALSWLFANLKVKWYTQDHFEIDSRINIRRSKLDLLINTFNSLVGIEFIVHKQRDVRSLSSSVRVRERSMEAYYVLENSPLNHYIVFQIFPNEEIASAAVQLFFGRSDKINGVNYLFAFVDNDLEIREVYSDLPQNL